MGIYNYNLYQKPLGYSYENMWSVEAITGGPWVEETDLVQMQQLSKMLNQQPEIESAKLLSMTPFIQSNWTSNTSINGKQTTYKLNYMESGLPESLGMKLIEGSWFSKEDKALNTRPIIVNKLFSDRVFPNQSPIGKTISSEESLEEGAIRTEIVGVFEEFRQVGEFSELSPYVINRYDLDVGNGHRFTSFAVKIKANVNVEYQEQLLTLLNGVAPQWEFTIESWSALRAENHRLFTIPMTVFGIISLFLMMMVGLGLFGVLWQNVTRRTQEIGLRRAMGATNISVHSQIIGELLVVSLFGLVIGTAILIQVPLLGLIEVLTWKMFWIGPGAASLLMLLLAFICAIYPSKVATSYSPAMALHYE
jgi:putative ABC transport system permease protein